MSGATTIPDRLLRILRSCEADETSCFPPTEVFNEGWMLRLVLDAFRTLRIRDHPLSFADGAKWYSEALLSSPFRPRSKADSLAEGFTNADGVIGHFDFRASTKAGLRLDPVGGQFVVIEAKMFSNLSAGTKNAPAYNQAARNVACMAAAIAHTSKGIADFGSLRFFVIAPAVSRRRPGISNLEACVEPDSVRLAVHQRIGAYEAMVRQEAPELRVWEAAFLLPLVDRLATTGRMGVLSWEDCIEAIGAVDRETGEDLRQFYQRCLSYSSHANALPPA